MLTGGGGGGKIIGGMTTHKQFMDQIHTALMNGSGTVAVERWGKVYGDPIRAAFRTREGVCVWMWRKGQRVRFYTADGHQIGPEQSNVAPAIAYARTEGWRELPEVHGVGDPLGPQE